MPTCGKRLAILFVAREQLGLSKTRFKQICRDHGGVELARELDDHGFASVFARLRRMGFTPSRKSGRRGPADAAGQSDA